MAFFKKDPPPPPPQTVIGSKTTLTGALSSRSDAWVRGVLEGPVSCAGTLTVETGGRVSGEITCQSLDCGGSAAGRCCVAGLAAFGPSASWDGELFATRLNVAKGARIVGKLGPAASKP